MNTENLKRLKAVLDAADDQARSKTRLKLEEELAAKAALLDAQLVQIEDLKADLKRAHTACLELDAEVEQTAERMQRVAFALCCGTFMVGAALGLIVASV
jgi:hypothetical protein